MNVIEEIIGYVSSKFKVAGLVVDLFKLEAQIAGLSIIPLVITAVLLAVLSLVAWTTLMVLLGYAIFWFLESVWIAILGVLLLHAIIIGGLIRYFLINLRKIKFEKTRAFLSRGKQSNEQKTKSRIGYSPNRKKVMARTGIRK